MSFRDDACTQPLRLGPIATPRGATRFHVCISIDFFLIQLSAYPGELQGDQLEALLLEALDDLADEPALDAIGLDHDESPLLISRHCRRDYRKECQNCAEHQELHVFAVAKKSRIRNAGKVNCGKSSSGHTGQPAAFLSFCFCWAI